MPRELANEFAGNSRFALVRRIGAGGIGLVYEAVDREYDARVALKTLQRLDGEALLRFKSEFRLLQDIHHPNLIELGELFEESGHWFFTMELLDGVDFMAYVARGLPRAVTRVPTPSEPSTLSGEVETTVIRPRRPSTDSTRVHLSTRRSTGQPITTYSFDQARLRDALRQLARGLHALHQAGMVHRDIKPHNVMVCQGRVVLLDFGLVSEERPWHRYGEESLVLGTPTYMAPEQAAGKPASPASDWYAVGTMLYEALTGTRPYEGHVSYLLMEKQSRDPLPPSLRVAHPEHIPSDLEDLCLALLRRDPAARPAGADILAQLDEVAPEISGPIALVSEATVELVGRSRELAVLRAALRECAPGRPVVAFVHGTSGMGKTALIECFAREARDRGGALVLRGRCYEREAVPYKAFDGVVDELSRHLKHLASRKSPDDPDIGTFGSMPWSTPFWVFDGGSASAQSEGQDSGPEWADEASRREPRLDHAAAQELTVLARLFPVLSNVLEPLRSSMTSMGSMSPMSSEVRDPGELRRRAFGALKALLTHVAGDQPLVMIIDDVQWSDLDSAALLSELIAPPDAPGLLLVASYRSEEAHRALVTSLRDSAQRVLGPGAVRELAVGPLNEEECHALALAIWQHLGQHEAQIDRYQQRILARAVRESGGSPFFVGEMVRYLVTVSHRDSGAIDADRSTLEQMLIERRSQLEPAPRALLDVVAVAGRPIVQGVALRAAGLDGSERSALAALRVGHFVRTRGPSLRDEVEVYHDRIREAVVARMDPDELRGHHAWLAEALEDWGSDDAEMLAEHYRGAGRLDRAAHYALLAAENAERALAFDRAAQMCRLLLEVRPDASADDRRALYVRLGNALANAGRGTEAAEAYLAAAESRPEIGGTDSRELSVWQPGRTVLAVECKRLAAEQLMCSGSIDRGLALFSEILASSGLHVPHSKRGALISLLLRRAQLRLRGLRYRPRLPADIPARERQRIEICWSGAVGLSVVDPLRGADFSVRCLLLSLRQGDEAHLTRTLVLEAGHVSYRGSKGAKRALALTRMATSISRHISDPVARSLTLFAPATIALHSGRWRRARDLLARAERSFREQCTGVAWELATVHLYQCLALYYLGEWGVLRKRAVPAVYQALERGDAYATAVLACFAAHGELCADDVDSAHRMIRMAEVHWTTEGYHLQHYFQLRGLVQIDLYSGDCGAAWTRFSADLRALRRSLLSRVQLTRVEIMHMASRCALALAATGHKDASKLIRLARHKARLMERERTPWTTALSLLVRAGVAACQGKRDQAIELLAQAIPRFQSVDMGLLAAAAAWQHGRLVGGDQGRATMAAAEEAMRARDVANPEAIANLLAPGFASRTGRSTP